MKRLVPVALLGLVSLPAMAGPKTDRASKTPTIKPSDANKATQIDPRTPQEKLLEITRDAIGSKTVCACQEGDQWSSTVGQLKILKPASKHLPINVVCGVTTGYGTKGQPSGIKNCSRFQVIGKLKKGDAF